MRNFSKWLFSVACAAIVLGGCTGKNGDPGPTGATGATGATGTTGASGQNLTGNIVGFVSPVDENGAALSKSGVIVSIDGTSPAVTATSNADGRFELTSVRNGTYNLTYTRSGLATFHRYGLGHVGGDQPTYLGTVSLSQIATSSVTALSATSSLLNGTVTLVVTLTSPTPTTNFRYALFASSTGPVASATGTLLFTSAATSAFSTTSYTFSTVLSRTTLTNAGFTVGSTVYLAAFGSTAVTAGYSDPATGRVLYPALSPAASPTVSVVVP